MNFFPVSSVSVVTVLLAPNGTPCLKRHVRIVSTTDDVEMKCGFGTTATDTSNLMLYRFGEPLYLTNPDLIRFPYLVFVGRFSSDTWNVSFSDSGDFYQPIASGVYSVNGTSTAQLPGTGRLRVLGKQIGATSMSISFGGPTVGAPRTKILDKTEHIFENVNTSHFSLNTVGGDASISITSGAV